MSPYSEASDPLRAIVSARTRLHAEVDSGASLDDVLIEIVRLVEEQCSGMLCSVLLIETDQKHFRVGAAPSLPAAYNALFQGVTIAEGVGSCGTAAYRKELVVVSDIESDPLWANYKEFALPFGLRACWSTPIWSGSQVIGTFASYYQEPRSPTAEELGIIQAAGELASTVIGRIRPDIGSEQSKARKTVLIVDDDDQYRALVAEFLKMDGCDILEAANAHVALSICARDSQKVDLVLTDVEMPGMNGYTLAAEVARLRPQTRVLLMSGNPGATLQVPSELFLEKPFTRSDLRRKISSIFK